MNNPLVHQCSRCGYEWAHGTHGGHSCVDTLDAHYEALRSQVAELQAKLATWKPILWTDAANLPAIIEQARAEEREECAKMCEEVVTYPAGHGGNFEGYGPVNATRSGKQCAAAIRARKGK